MIPQSTIYLAVFLYYITIKSTCNITIFLFAQSRDNKQARAAGSQVTPGMLGKLVGEVKRSAEHGGGLPTR